MTSVICILIGYLLCIYYIHVNTHRVNCIQKMYTRFVYIPVIRIVDIRRVYIFTYNWFALCTHTLCTQICIYTVTFSIFVYNINIVAYLIEFAFTAESVTIIPTSLSQFNSCTFILLLNLVFFIIFFFFFFC